MEEERRAELDRRLAMERTRFQDEKLYLAGEHTEAMEALGVRQQEELARLKGALAGLEVANKRQHEDLSIARAWEKQAEDQVATLCGQQHEQDRIITGLREALAAREATLSDAEARATQAQAHAALLEADLIAARSELSALRAEEVRLRVALAEARTELTVVQRERGVPRKGWRGVRSRLWLTIAPSPTVISCGLRPGGGTVKASPPPPPASRSLIVVVVEIAYRDKRIRA